MNDSRLPTFFAYVIFMGHAFSQYVRRHKSIIATVCVLAVVALSIPW